MTLNKQELLNLAKEASLEAGKAILEVYLKEDFQISSKHDNSPLTIADKNAHAVIVSFLERSGIPILSEEGKEISYDQRKQWKQFWMVDPLDGTKEFIHRNGEFTVNIALIEDEKSVLGVVYVPVKNTLFYAMKNEGAFSETRDITTQLKTTQKDLASEDLIVVASRSHLNDATKQYLQTLKNPQLISMGSSLKLTTIAQGKADVYPRFAPTMEWDIAAAQIVVEEAGGCVLSKEDQTPLRYNKQTLLNPDFIALPFKK